MRKLLILLSLLCLSQIKGYGQVVIENGEAEDEEINYTESKFKDTTHYTSILLIPFEKTMYNSDADQQIMEASGINYTQMVYRFRLAMLFFLKNHISKYYETKSLIEDPVKDTVDYLGRVYQSIGYKTFVKKNFGENFKNQNSSNISKGQIVTKEEHREIVTKVFVKNKSILDFINSELGSDIFIFIGMFEIKNDLTDYAAVGTNNFKRTIKVHFNVINLNGKNLAGDIATVSFSSKLNKIDDIIKKTFPDLADQIMMKTPQPKKVKKNTK